MRLRLTVQRHGLPPVQLLWTAGHILPAPYAAAGNSITIAQFVEQVNDIIPLESDDWGLEDYAVEVRGFECLHFSEVGQVLKEDDEVCIRPLQTSDLRIRKLSGRHQIASDGKHLIDGVAFGRQFLRVADRPAIRIPPRKRRRLTYGDEEEDLDEHDPVNDQQIVVRAGFDDADQAMAGDGSDDDDEDFAPDDEEYEDFHAELNDLQRDSNVDVHEGNDETVRDGQGKHKANGWSRRAARGLGLLALVDENGRSFPGEYENPLLDKYNQDEPSPRVPALRVRKRRSAKVAQSNGEHASRGAQESSASSARISRRSSAGSIKSVRFDDAEAETPATVREFEDSDDDDDSDFNDAGVNESDKENAEPRTDESNTSDDSFDSSESSSSAFSESQPSDGEETSSSGTSSSDTSSDSEPEQRTSKPIKQASGSSQASSSGSSSSDSDSGSDAQVEEPKVEASGSARQKLVHRKSVQKHQQALENSTPKDTKGNPETLPSAVSNAVTPGEGAQRTKTRNQRRKESRRLAYLKRQGLLPFDATKEDYLKFAQGNNKVGKIDDLITAKPSLNEDIGPGSEFEAKKQALLDSIISGGVDLTPAQDKAVMATELSPTDRQAPGGDDAMETEAPDFPSTHHDEAMDDAPYLAGDVDGEQMQAQAAIESPVTEHQTQLKGSPSSISEPRRSRLDLSSTKRMLFGSLGLRTPKTKEDEAKMREQLMKDAKPMRNPRLDKENEPVHDIEAASADDSWKDKIDLRAVECCHEGIELSTPPFPFVQRWDPQQQGGYSYSKTKKRKQKKRKRNDNSYYEESPYQSSQSKTACHGEFDTPTHASVRNDSIKSSSRESGGLGQEALHDESLQDSLRVSEQLRRETQERTLVEAEEAPDLPPLPKDPSTCSVLTQETATTGTVIAFKQFEMSANTNWQPRISNYRTAIIKEVLDEGSLQIELAKRDQPGKDSQYDDETGERIYGKFEMPGYDEEDDNIHNGKITIPFEELIDPIIVPSSAEHHIPSETAREATAEHADQDNMDHDGIQPAEIETSNNKQGNENHRESSREIEAEDPSTSQEGFSESLTLRGKQNAASQQSAGFDGAGEVIEVQAAMPSQDVRQEISELIRDAGWRSSLDPGVNRSLIVHQDNDATTKDDQAPADAPSLQFHGFGSTPPYSGIDVASSPLPADIQVARPEYHSDFEVADSVPPPDDIISEAQSMVLDSKLTVEYPDLPLVGDDSDLFHENAQHRSNPHNIDHDPPSQDLSSLNGIDQSPTFSARSRTRLSEEIHSPNLSKTLYSSDDEFPPLFSQAFEARMSQDVEIKAEISSQEPSISPPSKRKSKTKSKPNGTRSSSLRQSKPARRSNGKWSGLDDEDDDHSKSNDGADTPRPSQPPPGSEIVDLTISSDPPHTIYEDDDDDSFVLPSGPGWVKKERRSGGPRNVPAKANSGRRKTGGR